MFSLSENVFLQGVLKVKGELAPHSQNLILNARDSHNFSNVILVLEPRGVLHLKDLLLFRRRRRRLLLVFHVHLNQRLLLKAGCHDQGHHAPLAERALVDVLPGLKANILVPTVTPDFLEENNEIPILAFQNLANLVGFQLDRQLSPNLMTWVIDLSLSDDILQGPDVNQYRCVHDAEQLLVEAQIGELRL